MYLYTGCFFAMFHVEHSFFFSFPPHALAVFPILQAEIFCLFPLFSKFQREHDQDLFEYSLFQFPKEGFALRDVTRNLHGQEVCGVMTDYEEKFHSEGLPINHCVAVKTEKNS